MDKDFLSKRRVEIGLSQTKVAETLGYSTQTISLWENGKGSPSLPIWGKLASLYELDLEGLLLNKVKKENSLCEEKNFDAKEFGTNLKRLRKSKGLTQAELSEKLSIPVGAIIRFEQGVSFPDQEEFLSLVSFYNIKIDELYFSIEPIAPMPIPNTAKQKKISTWALTGVLILAGLVSIGSAVGIGVGIFSNNKNNVPIDSSSTSSIDISSIESKNSEPISEYSSIEESSSIESSEESSSFGSSFIESSIEESSEESIEESSAQESSLEESSMESSSEESSVEESSSEESSEESSVEESFEESSIEESSEESSSSEESTSSEESSEAPITYTIDFDLDGGTSSSYVGPIEVTSLEGVFFFDVIKENHNFKGWTYNNQHVVDENGVILLNLPIVDNMVFVAKYEAVSYPIYYVLDGGTNSENNPSSILYNEEIVLESAAKDGYLFVSWCLDSELTSEITTIKGSDAKENGSITLYAKFEYNSLDPYNYPYLSFIKLSGKKAKVTGIDESKVGTTLVIPDVIELDGVQYTVTEIADYAFNGYSGIDTIVFPKYLESVGAYAFKGCTSLEGVRILSSSDSAMSIGDGAFSSCSMLQWAKIGYQITSLGDDIFVGAHEKLIIMTEGAYDPDWGTRWNSEHKPVVMGGKGFSAIGYNGIMYCALSDGYTDGYTVVRAYNDKPTIRSTVNDLPVAMISTNAFYGNSDITEINIPDSMVVIGDYSFAGCTGLSSIHIPYNVDTIWTHAFYNCSNLTINCEAESKPSGWDSSWNPSNRPVNWGV